MADNYFRDNEDLRFHMENIPWEQIIPGKEQARLKDDGTLEKDGGCEHDSLDAAIAFYTEVLDEVVGPMAAQELTTRSEKIDREGCTLKNGMVKLPQGLIEDLDALKDQGLMGFTLPYEYGGMNLPTTLYCAATEIISRADASLMNMFGLQGIAETILQFGTDEQKKNYLPRFAAGEATGAMALTEANQGSQLDFITTRGDEQPDGSWRVSGEKIFITNGCADVSLILARTEKDPNHQGGRGLSVLLVEKGEGVRVERLEEKLGIHGSPTCVMIYDNAPAQLIGKRKSGPKIMKTLMYGARVQVAAQGIGVAQAAYAAALRYSEEREQFRYDGTAFPIQEHKQVQQHLNEMRLDIEASRNILYLAAQSIDIAEALRWQAGVETDNAKKKIYRAGAKRASRTYNVLAPLTKYHAGEMAPRVTDAAQRVLAGAGYVKDSPVERYLRDARIIPIYEGTAEIQVQHALKGMMAGNLDELLQQFADTLENAPTAHIADVSLDIQEIHKKYSHALDQLRIRTSNPSNEEEQKKHAQENARYLYFARPMVDIAADLVAAYVFAEHACKSDKKKRAAELFVDAAKSRVDANYNAILSGKTPSEDDFQTLHYKTH